MAKAYTTEFARTTSAARCKPLLGARLPHSQVTADLPSQDIVDFAVPWDC
jgi:hypothetical protein